MKNLIELIGQAEEIEQLAEYKDHSDLLKDNIYIPDYYTYKECDEYKTWLEQLKQRLYNLQKKVYGQDFQGLIDAIYELENNNYGERTAFKTMKHKLYDFMKLDNTEDTL